MLNYITYFFWICVFIVFYSYLGYGILLFLLVKISRFFNQKEKLSSNYQPNVTLLIAAYNEESYIKEKIENSLKLDYPKDKIQYLFVTDGSDDKTPDIVKEYPQIRLMHRSERQGKIVAVARAMSEVTSEIVIFTDANTNLNKAAVKNIVRHFANEKVGVVSGEKRILSRDTDEAAGAGEGFYWKYESQLKKWDDELCSVMGAAA